MHGGRQAPVVVHGLGRLIVVAAVVDYFFCARVFLVLLVHVACGCVI